MARLYFVKTTPGQKIIGVLQLAFVIFILVPFIIACALVTVGAVMQLLGV